MDETKMYAIAMTALLAALCSVVFCITLPSSSTITVIAYGAAASLVLAAYAQAIYYILSYVLDVILRAARKI